MSHCAPLPFVSLPTIILFLNCCAVVQSEERESYIAAVVEYQQPIGPTTDVLPQTILHINAENYVGFIKEAKIHNADIVVFPEYGLTSLGIPSDPIAVRPFLVSIPEIGANPCMLPDSHPVIRKLSCTARVETIYVAINIGEIDSECKIQSHTHETGGACEDEDIRHYNTNIVFNRKGEIVAKYRKFHLYFEPQFHQPTIPDYVTFETDFGVTFGTFICFDIIFQHPAEDYVRNGIQNFVFPTAWVDELPFLTATQSNALWAMSAGTNLLVSGYHEPSGGRMGSGIFSGFAGPLNYTFDPSSGSKLIIAEVPIVPYTNSVETPQSSRPFTNQLWSNHFFLQENLTDYSTIPLEVRNGAEEATVCHNDFCCTVDYSFEASDSDRSTEIQRGGYRLLAFRGFRKVANRTAEFGWEVCGVTRCLNATLESCTEIRRQEEFRQRFNWFKLSTMSTDVGQPMKPSLNTLDTQLQSIPFNYFNFTRAEGHVEATSSSLSEMEVQTIALINRIY